MINQSAWVAGSSFSYRQKETGALCCFALLGTPQVDDFRWEREETKMSAAVFDLPIYPWGELLLSCSKHFFKPWPFLTGKWPFAIPIIYYWCVGRNSDFRVLEAGSSILDLLHSNFKTTFSTKVFAFPIFYDFIRMELTKDAAEIWKKNSNSGKNLREMKKKTMFKLHSDRSISRTEFFSCTRPIATRPIAHLKMK